jgi:hypothetical protein
LEEVRLKDKVICQVHGEQEVTLVCQHIAQGLVEEKKVGFFWANDPQNKRPDAWCISCEEKRLANNGEWSDDCNSFLGVKWLCANCYDLAREFNLSDKSLEEIKLEKGK